MVDIKKTMTRKHYNKKKVQDTQKKKKSNQKYTGNSPEKPQTFGQKHTPNTDTTRMMNNVL